MEHLAEALRRMMGATITPEVAHVILRIATMPADDRSIDLAPFAPQPITDGDYVVAAERFRDIVAELHPLHVAHFAETERYRRGLPLVPDYDALVDDERAGGLLQFTLRHRGALVGNLRMYIRCSRHTSTLFATREDVRSHEDTLYVAPEHRGGFLAMSLLRYAEQCLRKLGVIEIRANSKLVNNADVLMRRMKYRPDQLQLVKFVGEGYEPFAIEFVKEFDDVL
jgi:GNAT superfamily N-acetyltransferase